MVISKGGDEPLRPPASKFSVVWHDRAVGLRIVRVRGRGNVCYRLIAGDLPLRNTHALNGGVRAPPPDPFQSFLDVGMPTSAAPARLRPTYSQVGRPDALKGSARIPGPSPVVLSGGGCTLAGNLARTQSRGRGSGGVRKWVHSRKFVCECSTAELRIRRGCYLGPAYSPTLRPRLASAQHTRR